MHPQIPKSSRTGPRSHSPVVPGAWPSSNPPTPLHKRSKTCPVTSNIPSKSQSVFSTSPDPLHLDHVLNFHQRLSLSLSRPTDSADVSSSFTPFTASESAGTSLGPSGSGSIPSDDSDLTRVTQHDTSVSHSVFGDTSVSTTCTSHSSSERLVTAKLPNLLKHSHEFPTIAQSKTNNLHGTLIHRHPGPNTNPSSVQLPSQSHGNRDKPKNKIESQKQEVLQVIKSPTIESPTPSPPTRLSRPDRPRINLPESRIPIFTAAPPPHSPCPTSPTSLTPSSPIVFASPTSSHHAFPFREARTPARDRSSSYEYEGSPSWETSYGSEYNDEDMLRLGSRSLSPSPSPFPPIRSEIVREERGQAIEPEMQESETRSPSIDIDLRALPMLTTLSLPTSPNTSCHISLDTNPASAPSPSTSPRLSLDTSHDIPGILPLSPASPPISLPPTSPTSLSLSLSPTSSFRAELGVGVSVGEGHNVTFPSPSPSASPFASALPSPALDGSSALGDVCTNGLRETTAAEYAAAIMSSAWGSDEHPSIGTISPALTGAGVDGSGVGQVNGMELPPGDRTIDEGVPVEEGVIADLGGIQYYPQPRGTRTGGVLAKVKRLGGKMRRLWGGKSKGGKRKAGVSVDVDVDVGDGSEENPRVVPDALAAGGGEGMADIVVAMENPITSQVDDTVPGLDLRSIGADDHIPLSLPGPPGLTPRARKPRPSLTAQTYTSTSSVLRNDTLQITSPFVPSLIRVCPPSSPSRAHSYLQPQNNADIKGKDKAPIRAQLESKFKTKSQAPEIKSNRHLSLSALSSLARSSSPSSAPPISISRPRPRSTLALTSVYSGRNGSATETESFQATRYVDGFMPDVPVIHIRQRGAIGPGAVGPPGVPLSRSSNEHEFTTTSTPTRSTSIPALSHAQTATQAKAGKKEDRRFSLSAISNFAVSQWDGSLRKRYSVGVGRHDHDHENGRVGSDV